MRQAKDFLLLFPFAIPMKPQIMVSISTGPNQAYADEYAKVNNRINELSRAISSRKSKSEDLDPNR